jgi:uncharacterized membrane protein YdjX (TVP38/TMEM64 family)
MASLQQLLQQAAQHTDPASLAWAVLAMTLIPFLFFIPVTASGVLVGALLPWQLAVPVILLGLGFNTIITWRLARSVFGRRLESWVEKQGGTLGFLHSQAQESPFKWAFISRYVPAPFIITPLVLAGAGAPLAPTLWGTILAMVPWAFAYAWAGRAGREGSLHTLGMASALGVCILGLAYWLRRRYVVPVDRNPQPLKAVPKKKPSRRGRSKA